MTIKLTTFIGATGAYACIHETNSAGYVRALDVLLTGTGSVSKQLSEEAGYLREKAARLIGRAELIERAITASWRA